MRVFLALVISVLCCQWAGAQQVTLTGRVVDTADHKVLANAVVALQRTRDSVLYKFTRSDKEGAFHFGNLIPGTYRLLVSFPRFADYVDDITIKEHDTPSDLTIPLTPKAKLLDAVVIRSAGAIRIKGDTTEFVADSFHVKEGATVEELLKKLPGFQVNSKGEITAQGQRVQKVLVDGEEFFGDDPTMATKNLSARAVDKVQVFDNKSEQQNITGISSGSEGKTVNIKLKQDSKKGSFGTVEAGSNWGDIQNAKLLFNKFAGQRKISLYGTKSKTTTGSLNWEEGRKLGLENDFEYDEISGYYFSFGTADDFNDWSLRGLPDAYTAGGLYINKWHGDKHALNSSYRFNRLGTSNIASRVVQNIVPGTVFTTTTGTRSNGLNQQHVLNLKYEWKLDSLASLKLTTVGTYKKTTSFNNTLSETTNDSTRYTTIDNRTNTYDALRQGSDNQLQYKQLFHKKNRLLLATLRLGVTGDDQTGYIDSHVEYYNAGAKDSSRVIDQQKMNTGNSTTYGLKVTYSEPVSLKWTLITEYGYNTNNATSHKNTFDKSLGGKYELLNSIYSNNFDLDVTSNSGTVITRYFYKKFRMAFGSGISSVRLNLHNLDRATQNTYNFFNITPQSSINYTIKPQNNIGLNYRGTTRQPTIEQLQPIRDNSDPLNEYVGNPDLKVGFNHNVSLFYNSYKVLSARGIWINLSYNRTDRAITQSSTISPYGKRVYKPVNVDGNNNWFLWSEWNKGEGDNKLRHTVRARGNGGRTTTIINGLQNQSTYYTMGLEYGIGYQSPEKYSFNLVPKVEYNSTKASLNRAADNQYYSYGGTAEGFVMLPGRLELNSSCEFNLNQRVAAFGNTNPNIILWNASLARKVFKDKSGKLVLEANDILDQNKGFTRLMNSNIISEERYQRISRYLMLRFEWTFNKMPGSN